MWILCYSHWSPGWLVFTSCKTKTKSLICLNFFTNMSNVYILPKFEFYTLRMEMNILQKDVYMSKWGSNWGPNLLLLYSIEWNSQSTSNRMNVPKKYRLESILTTAYIINRLSPCLLGGNSALETFTHKPNSFLVRPKVFGCTCFVHRLRPKCKDLNPGIPV